MLFDRSGEGADYERLVVVQDAPSGLRAIIAIHSTKLGPAAGGIRRWRYHDEAAALADALRLAEGMTLKCALAGLDAGGAKTVVLDHGALRVADAYRRLGDAVEALGGGYLAGPDVGTGEAEMACVRERTRHVNAPGNDASASTARGVLAGIRGVMRVLEGAPAVEGRRFVVQGLGGVGSAVARGLLAGGAEVAGCDLDPRAVEAARTAGVRIVSPERVLDEPCDVFVPCALGGVLSEDVARRLPAHAVCGSANNQLAHARTADVLRERGIVHAPDFLVNAGAVIEGVMTARGGATEEVRARAMAHIDTIEHRLAQVLEEAARDAVSPQDVALRRAHERLAAP